MKEKSKTIIIATNTFFGALKILSENGGEMRGKDERTCRGV